MPDPIGLFPNKSPPFGDGSFFVSLEVLLGLSEEDGGGGEGWTGGGHVGGGCEGGRGGGCEGGGGGGCEGGGGGGCEGGGGGSCEGGGHGGGCGCFLPEE